MKDDTKHLALGKGTSPQSVLPCFMLISAGSGKSRELQSLTQHAKQVSTPVIQKGPDLLVLERLRGSEYGEYTRPIYPIIL